MLSSLNAELLLQVLCKSTRTVAVQVIRDDKGVGDIPGIQGVQGEVLQVLRNKDLIDTRTQT